MLVNRIASVLQHSQRRRIFQLCRLVRKTLNTASPSPLNSRPARSQLSYFYSTWSCTSKFAISVARTSPRLVTGSFVRQHHPLRLFLLGSPSWFSIRFHPLFPYIFHRVRSRPCNNFDNLAPRPFPYFVPFAPLLILIVRVRAITSNRS